MTKHTKAKPKKDTASAPAADPAPARPPFTLPPERLDMLAGLLIDVAFPELRLDALTSHITKEGTPAAKRKTQRPGSGKPEQVHT
jgi:hypothetical protein